MAGEVITLDVKKQEQTYYEIYYVQYKYKPSDVYGSNKKSDFYSIISFLSKMNKRMYVDKISQGLFETNEKAISTYLWWGQWRKSSNVWTWHVCLNWYITVLHKYSHREFNISLPFWAGTDIQLLQSGNCCLKNV